MSATLQALLGEHAFSVADRVIAEEEGHREHVVVYLSGAHAYGFPSPDSDLDLKAIHLADARALLGLSPPAPTADRQEIVEGVEIDYTSNELGHALVGITKGNGNFLERVLGETVFFASPALDELRPLARRALSRRVRRHYEGFARQQLAELDRRPTVKRLLYVLRTALTGSHLLRSGELVTDVRRLLDERGIGEAHALIEAKRGGERTPLSEERLAAWRARLGALVEGLAADEATSPLPAEAPNRGELDAWLVATRVAHLTRSS